MTVNLKEERINRGLTVNEAAEAMGVSRTALIRAEAGAPRPTPGNAFKIASYYGHLVTEVWPLEDVAA